MSSIESVKPFGALARRFCIFEYVYFARPDSAVEGHSVYEVRKRIGAELAREAPTQKDIVIKVQISIPAYHRVGYAQAAGLPFELGLIRNHASSRASLHRAVGPHPPSQDHRYNENANSTTVAGRRVVPGRQFDRARHYLNQDRGNGAPCGRDPSAHAGRQPADHPLLLLRCRHAGARPVAGRAQRSREHGADHRRGQPRVPVSGWHVSGSDRHTPAPTSSPQYCDACFSGDYPTGLRDFGRGGGADQLSLMLDER